MLEKLKKYLPYFFRDWTITYIYFKRENIFNVLIRKPVSSILVISILIELTFLLLDQVSDAANVMGLAHAENITVQAEAYDVALDMSFPKGIIFCSTF